MTRNHKFVEIGILLYPGARSSVVHGLTELFDIANRLAEPRPSQKRTVLRASHWRRSLKAPHRITRAFDTHGAEKETYLQALIVPPCLGDPLSPECSMPLARWLAARHDEGVTLCSVCTGAFLLGEAGLLNGRQVTTHWQYEEKFRRRFPAAKLNTELLLADEGKIMTAGGVMAWTDLGLTLVRRFLGEQAMRDTARFLVLDPPGREQRFYTEFRPELRHEDPAVLRVQEWLSIKGAKGVSLSKMAAKAGLEPRTFLRRFKKATGLNPLEYCQHLRIEKARQLLERTGRKIDNVSRLVGYEDSGAFRKVFHRVTGLAPADYRGRFGKAH